MVLTITLDIAQDKYDRGLACIQATMPIPMIANPEYVVNGVEPEKIPACTAEAHLGNLFGAWLFDNTKRYETRLARIEAAKEKQEDFVTVVQA